ncbi:MAG: hypothetical protein PHS38_08620 [Bacteroidales bacterium]|nr:hypothetical protein [Bacteroidales bacterium]
MDFINYAKKTRRRILQKYAEFRNTRSRYSVEGNIKNSPKLLFVLAGYKPYLWDDVFKRIKTSQLDDMDVCISSSGKYCKELSSICRENDWIYLSTKLNNVCVMTNIILKLFSKAEYIFKMDEDIYLPKNYFSSMIAAYDKIEADTEYEIGYILPTMPLGVYAMHNFLKERGKLKEYENKFGKHIIGGTSVNPVLREHIGVDEFIWSLIGNFDDCARDYSEKPFSYEICPIRPSIASILFKRKFWDDLGLLKKFRDSGVGDSGDEGQMTTYCALNYRACFCVKNLMVGHFAFGGSEPNVLKIKDKHPEYFEFNETQ